MNIAGIDYSLRSPAICVFAGDYSTQFSFNKCMFYYLTDVKKHVTTYGNNIIGQGFEIFEGDSSRYDSISSWALDKVSVVDHIALEGYSFGSKGHRLFQIAENTGVLKYKLYQSGIPVEVLPPSQVKKFATKKGNANKEKMYEAFVEETGVDLAKEMTPLKKDIGNPVSDIIDSYYICKLLHEQFICANHS